MKPQFGYSVGSPWYKPGKWRYYIWLQNGTPQFPFDSFFETGKMVSTWQEADAAGKARIAELNAERQPVAA
jgi:hypothetical protein